MWRRSASSPSDTSVMAVAPASAAAASLTVGRFGHQVPAAQFGEIRRSRCCHSAYPAADRPRSPATATVSPGVAPLRRTGARPSRSPSTVTEITHCGLLTRSPPTMPAPPSGRPRAHIPSDSSATRRPAVSAGRAERRRRTPSRRAPSPRCRRRSARSPCVRRRAASTSPAGNAVLRPACRWTPRPARRAPAPRPRRHRARSARRPVGDAPLIRRSMTVNSPELARRRLARRQPCSPPRLPALAALNTPATCGTFVPAGRVESMQTEGGVTGGRGLHADSDRGGPRRGRRQATRRAARGVVRRNT